MPVVVPVAVPHVPVAMVHARHPIVVVPDDARIV
jgi:hypothetical protein